MYNLQANNSSIATPRDLPPSYEESQSANTIRLANKKNSFLAELRQENFSPADIKNIGEYLIQASNASSTQATPSDASSTQGTPIVYRLQSYFIDKLKISEMEFLRKYGDIEVSKIFDDIDVLKLSKTFSLMEVKQIAILAGMKPGRLDCVLIDRNSLDNLDKTMEIFRRLRQHEFYEITVRQLLDAVS